MQSEFPALERAWRHAMAHLNGLDTRPVATTTGLDDLRRALRRPLGAQGASPETVIDDLVRDTLGGQLGTASGRFFGWVMGGALPSALAADWLASTWDANAASYASGPAAAVVEEIAGEWIKEIWACREAPPSPSPPAVSSPT